MPGFNKKGPNGEGAMSGRGRGRCNPANRDSNHFEAERGADLNFQQGDERGMRQGQRRRDGSGKRRMR